MVAVFLSFMVILLLLVFLTGTYRIKAPQFTKCNRSCQRYLFRALWIEGYYPEVGYNVGNHEIDIAFPYSKVAVICGWNHWEADELLLAKTKKKVCLLREKGWKVISLSPKEIYGNPKLCVEKIEENISMAKLIF